jgi:hypothetical protein
MVRKLFLFGALCAVLIGPSRVHDDEHASDWIGDHELKNANNVPCCGKGDLRRTAGRRRDIDCGRLRVNGWAPIRSHDFVGKPETLPSQDQHCWRCESHGERICFLVPPRYF